MLVVQNVVLGGYMISGLQNAGLLSDIDQNIVVYVEKCSGEC